MMQVGREEKAEWINGLAKLYSEQGLSKDTSVAQKLADVIGLSEWTIGVYLDNKYKLN